jgi:hypothetical protein
MKRFFRPLALGLALGLGGLMSESNAQAVINPTCSAPEYRQFDFWLGEWDVFDYSSGKKGALVGFNRIVRLYDGCVLQENWESSDGSSKGTSLNSYFNLDKKWHQTWVDNAGYLLALAGEFKDGTMTLEGSHPGRNAGVTVINRIAWNIIGNDPTQVRQFWQASRDGGKTWSVLFDGLYVRRK